MFTYILYGVAIIGLIISLIKSKKKTKMALKKAWKAFENLMPQFLSILVIIGLVFAIFTPDQIQKVLGEGAGVYGVLLSLVIGAAIFIPGFVAFPLAAALLQNGAGYAQVAAFISALMMVGVITIPLEVSIFGKKSTAIRNVAALIFSVIVAIAMGGLLS
jgi:uncharacterized membrane protein YraQ (UPF0718 family)